jgi:protein-S-isoprenylcysteine O-methyltransferase Ste14
VLGKLSSALLGFVLAKNSLSFFITFFLLRRIKIEEKMLLDRFGAEYGNYMESTKKLIPFIYWIIVSALNHYPY